MAILRNMGWKRSFFCFSITLLTPGDSEMCWPLYCYIVKIFYGVNISEIIILRRSVKAFSLGVYFIHIFLVFFLVPFALCTLRLRQNQQLI